MRRECAQRRDALQQALSAVRAMTRIILYDYLASHESFVHGIDPSGDVMGTAGRRPADEENMSASANKIAAVVLMLGLPAATALADSPPKLNVAPSCDAAARGAISAGRDKEACLVDERTAEDVLAQNWSKYDAADKTQCVGNVKTGGPASYVELLSCLEIMRDAKAIRQGDALAPPDRPSGLMRRRR
jgi:hypothetical protein